MWLYIQINVRVITSPNNCVVQAVKMLMVRYTLFILYLKDSVVCSHHKNVVDDNV